MFSIRMLIELYIRNIAQYIAFCPNPFEADTSSEDDSLIFMVQTAKKLHYFQIIQYLKIIAIGSI